MNGEAASALYLCYYYKYFQRILIDASKPTESCCVINLHHCTSPNRLLQIIDIRNLFMIQIKIDSSWSEGYFG